MEIKVSEHIRLVLVYARDEAMRTGWYGISIDHLMLGLIRHRDNEACRCLHDFGIDIDALKESIDSDIFLSEQIPFNKMEQVVMTKTARAVMNIAAFEALKSGAEEVKPIHLLTAICRTKNTFSRDLLDIMGITPDKLAEFCDHHQDNASTQALPTLNTKEMAGVLGEQLDNLFGASPSQTKYLS